jgi:hypothetical protein
MEESFICKTELAINKTYSFLSDLLNKSLYLVFYPSSIVIPDLVPDLGPESHCFSRSHLAPPGPDAPRPSVWHGYWLQVPIHLLSMV